MSPETKVAVHVDGRTLTLTNLAKVLYPQTGFTKAEVLDYYQRVATGPAAAHHRPPADPEALPRGRRRRGLLPEARHRTPPGLDPHRQDPLGQLARPRHHGDLPRGGRPARAHLGGQPGRPGTARAAVAAARTPPARPAGLRPGSRSPRQHRGLLPGGGGPAAAAGGRGLRAAGQDLRRQGPAAVRPDLRRDLRAGQRPGPRLRRTARTRSAAPGGVADDQGAAHRQGPHRLEPEQRVQDHRRPLLAARPAEPHGLDPGQLGRGAGLPAPGGTVLHRRHGPGPGGQARRPVRAAAPVTVR